MSQNREHVPGFINRVLLSKSGIWFPGLGLVLPRHHNVLAVLTTPEGKRLIPAANIVGNAGDVYYAQLAAAEATTETFDRQVMCTAGTPGKAANRSSFTEIAASIKALDGGFPKTNDGDADNTGAGIDITTWLTSWTKGDFNDGAITHGMIVGSSPVSNDPILTGYAFASTFAKTADDTLKVFVNHPFDGQ